MIFSDPYECLVNLVMKKDRENRKVGKVVLEVKKKGEIGYNSVGITIRKIQYTHKFLDSGWELFVKTLAFSDLSQFSNKEMVL